MTGPLNTWINSGGDWIHRLAQDQRNQNPSTNLVWAYESSFLSEKLLEMCGSWVRKFSFAQRCSPWMPCLIDDLIPMHIQVALSRFSGFKEKEYIKLWGKSDGDRTEKLKSREKGGFNQIKIHYMHMKFQTNKSLMLEYKFSLDRILLVC